MIDRAHDGEIRRLASRVRQIASGIAAAHADGHGPGDRAIFPTADMMRLIVDGAPSESLGRVAEALGQHYRTTTARMIVRGAPDGLAEDWVHFVDIMRQIADGFLTVASQTGESGEQHCHGHDDDADVVKAIRQIADVAAFPFSRMAELSSAETITRIAGVAGRVERALADTTDANPLSR